MNFLPFLDFFSFLMYFYLAAFILIKNPKFLLNRVVSAFLVCFGIWSFGQIFLHEPDISKNTVRLFDNIGSFGWVSFSSFFLWLALIFTEKKKILKTRIFYLFLFGLPLLFIYKQYTNFLMIDYIKQSWGWENVSSKSIWPYLFYAYYSSFMVMGLSLILYFWIKTKESIKKKQAKIIFTSAVIPLTLGTMTDVILPELNIYSVPNIASSIVLIWAFGLVYVITKYRLFVLTPAAAADDMMQTMIDSLLLIDPQGEIKSVNRATLDLLGYKKEELVGKAVATIFEEEKEVEEEEVSIFKGTRLQRLIKEGTVRDYDMKYRTKKGEIIPVSFSGSVMRDEEGELVGIVGIARDIREIKRLMQK